MKKISRTVRKTTLFLFIVFSISLSDHGCFASNESEPLAVISLAPHPGGTAMVTMRAEVRGHKGVFLFDTGGGLSFVTPAFAREIGCEPWGRITGFQLSGHRLDMTRCDELPFEISGQHFTKDTVGVFDIMKFFPTNTPQIDGSIGLDLFDGKMVTFSLGRKLLVIESPGSFTNRIQHGQEIPIRLVREAEGAALAIVAAVATPKGTAWMEIDSGNGGAFVIGKHLASLLNLDPAAKEPQPIILQLGGKIPARGLARINENLIMDGNIGVGFLLKWDLTLDLAKGRAWVAQAEIK